jgi:tRNA(Ile)-lysidine synthase
MRRGPDDAIAMLQQDVLRVLDAHVPAGTLIAVALSGGRDSVVLLDALQSVAPARGHRLHALHVHHGLSPHADAWQAACRALCDARGIALTVCPINVPRLPQTSLEAEARRLRYAVLGQAAATAGARFIALAHHRDDQAETLLLQLLRGAGPHGLAGMAEARVGPDDVTYVRPLLAVPRAAIDAYAAATHLAFVDDASNAMVQHRRNAVRHTLMPAVAALFPNPAATLARAAAHQAEAAQLADDLAALDARDIHDGTTLSRAGLAALAPHRARNLLRWFLRRQGLPAPSTARLAAMLSQLTSARGDANVRIAHAGVEVGMFRGRIVLHASTPAGYDIPWRGEPELALPHGRLLFASATGAGLDAKRLVQAPVSVRPRSGGERLKLAANRPRQALGDLLHDAGMPPWEREGLPLVFCGDALVAVPEVGVDVAFQAPPGATGYRLDWRPSPWSKLTGGVDLGQRDPPAVPPS